MNEHDEQLMHDQDPMEQSVPQEETSSTKLRKQCSVCGSWFWSENGLVSCFRHSFGEVEES